MKKIIVIGLTGSGKTTFANKLGKILDIPVHHLDKLFWKANWQASKQAEFFEKQVEIIENNESWIIEGGFPRSKSLDLRIEHADTIIFFDIPIMITLWRMFKRYLRYFGKERPDVGNNNKPQWPLRWFNVKYALEYPTKEIYKKILPLQNIKMVTVIKNNKDIRDLLDNLR